MENGELRVLVCFAWQSFKRFNKRGTVQKGIIDRLIWIIHRKRHSLKRTRYASPRRYGRFIGMLDGQIGDGDYKQLRSCWQDS